MSHTLFIADLHLSEQRPDITAAFFEFLHQKVTAQTDGLYILGDLFEYWIGDDNNSPFNQSIIKALKQTSQITPVYFIHGNRDFAIGERFAKAANITLLPEHHIIDLYGVKALILHGDSMCTLDEAFMKFRRKSRNPRWQQMMLLLPLFVRRHYANKSRKNSQQYQQNVSDEITDVTPFEVLNQLAINEVNLMIHGHTHRPNIHHIEQTPTPSTRIVLGDWYEQGSYLIVDKSGFELVGIPRQSIHSR